MSVHYFVVKELYIPKIETMKQGGMGFFKDLLCFIHLFPQNVKLEEINDYDPYKKPKDKLVIEVSFNQKWNGYGIYYPTYVFLQCKYCPIDQTVKEINQECRKRIDKILESLNTEFANMIYDIFNINVHYSKSFIEELADSEGQSSSELN